MVFLAGAPYYELVKEREGAPSFLPCCSRLFSSIFPSFSVTVLTEGLIFRVKSAVAEREFKLCIQPLSLLFSYLLQLPGLVPFKSFIGMGFTVLAQGGTF